MPSPLISSSQLNQILNEDDLIILDASQKGKSIMTSEFDEVQIKGARYFDIKNVFSYQSSSYPNTFPPAFQFEKECQNLGINKTSKIVVYDRMGIFSSPRVWWMLKTMGHKNVQVLNGGLPDWVNEGFETETTKDKELVPGNFRAKLNQKAVKDIEFVIANIESSNTILIDARSEGRFKGTAPEPREGLDSGHIPNSLNLAFTKVLENGKFKSNDELKKIFSKLNLKNKSLIFSCGSGITTCIILLAAELVINNPKAVYDGSWTEWATMVKRV